MGCLNAKDHIVTLQNYISFLIYLAFYPHHHQILYTSILPLIRPILSLLCLSCSSKWMSKYISYVWINSPWYPLRTPTPFLGRIIWRVERELKSFIICWVGSIIFGCQSVCGWGFSYAFSCTTLWRCELMVFGSSHVSPCYFGPSLLWLTFVYRLEREVWELYGTSQSSTATSTIESRRAKEVKGLCILASRVVMFPFRM